MRKLENKSSKYIGVHVTSKKRKNGSPYVYGYLNHGDTFHSKLFNNEEDAAKWYNEKAKTLRGSAAILNEFPHES